MLGAQATTYKKRKIYFFIFFVLMSEKFEILVIFVRKKNGTILY